MLETTILCLVAWLLLAATSFRHRRAFGIMSPMTIRALRIIGAALLAAALLRCGTTIDGERCVRFLGGASIAAAIIVVLLSCAPTLTMAPVAALVRAGTRR